MWRRDNEQFQSVSRALGSIGIGNFLIFGLREKKPSKDDENTMEAFYCWAAENRIDLVAAIRDISLHSPDIRRLLIDMLYEICHAEKKGLEELLGEDAGARQPIAKA